jgi:GT2 family glycosyltransferase
MSEITAVIVNWNGGTDLEKTVRSLMSTSDADVVIVDNASSDRSLDTLVETDPRLRVIRNARNEGYTGGINRGFRETQSQYVLILNPDARARPGAIGALKSALDANPGAGAVGGYVNERYLPRPLPTVASLILENLGFSPRRLARDSSRLVRVDQLAGAALMIRRETFDEVGGFDEQFYPAWYEDVDFACALAAAGWETYYDPSAKFDHVGGHTFRLLGTEGFMVAYYANQFRYVRKHFSSGPILSLKIALVLGVGAKMIRHPGEIRSYWRGLLPVMKA